jgi:MerR family transcriptional regulator, Zn(II)-responsive regulator of zntA
MACIIDRVDIDLFADKGETPCPTVRRIVEICLEDVERGFRDLALLKERMHAAIEDWNDKPDRSPNGHMICHLIENFPIEEQQ